MKTRLLAMMALFLVCPLAAHAQWLTESFTLTNGWNALFVHVDASHTTLDQLVPSDGANPIRESTPFHHRAVRPKSTSTHRHGQRVDHLATMNLGQTQNP